MLDKTVTRIGLYLVAGLLFTGNVTADQEGGSGVTLSDSSKMTQSGFLSDYGRLRPTAAGEGAECWSTANLDSKAYNKVMISRMVVTLKSEETQAVDPTELKMLTDYFNDSLVEALKPQMGIAEAPGTGVIAIRIALTDLVPTKVSGSVASALIPYSFVFETAAGAVKGRETGTAPYLGETGIEIQFLDGASRKILGECRDTRIGRKHAGDLDAEKWAKGYMNSFESWAYAKDAFDKWSGLIAKRFAALF